ncbi:hypothetical protein IV203_004203 [Nitzschia inconspicua]|uniref:Uncharacterized protein n=1 Tax=Nitzschia inconspicua TaxID=303405 RepID=A0A9K3L3W2_9STRA|nr:hypothetical protein IV203_004203 [Nitzschia inconspicua]
MMPTVRISRSWATAAFTAIASLTLVSSFQFTTPPSAYHKTAINSRGPLEMATATRRTFLPKAIADSQSLFSDIPRDEDMLDSLPPGSTTGGNKIPNKNTKRDNHDNTNPPFKNVFASQQERGEKSWWKRFVPPPPEDQFIITGDICVLFFYAFTSHTLNDYIVNSMLQRNDMTILQAVHSLDPMGEVVNTQIPSWVQTQNQLAVDHVLSVNAQETLLNHWGPLFSTEGSACVALCTCWLIAGWVHRAFLFQNSVDCTTDKALSKTVETWLSTCVMMVALAMAANAVVEHIPALQTLLCVQCAAAKSAVHGATGMDGTIDSTSGELLLGTAATTTSSVLALTKADTMFIVDSMSVLIAWRFMANKMLNIFR